MGAGMTRTGRAAAAAALMVLTAGASAAGAATFKGVSFPDAVSIAGRECRLNGVGVRTKFFVKVYLGALYLAVPSHDPAAAIAADEPKRIVMHFVHSKVEAEKIRGTLLEGLRENAGAALPQLQERVDRLLGWIADDALAGDEVVFTYLPGQGTELSVKGQVRGVVPGADVMRALWSVWLGAKPADAGLKQGLLGAP
jgi:hypothetical protein